MARVLIADDEESIRMVLGTALTQAGHEVATVASGGDALNELTAGEFDVAILDIRMPDLSGLDVLERIRATDKNVIVIVVTAQNTMANAIEAMKRGAFNYLTKPFDLEEVRALVTRASEMHELTRTVGRIRTEVGGRYEPGVNLVGTSGAMQEIFKTIGRVAKSDATILIEGESGTGKELIARAIHAHSTRWSGPFVALNCSAIPRDLLESELFGHERGAFTGASERRVGRFESAAGGTLFLDEIGDMPIELQVKLLRVLQEREFSRVGSTLVLKANARIIAATNQSLERAVREQRFREDLFFRLKVVPITVPPLRDRRGDIPELIRHFLTKINAESGTDITAIAPEAEDMLMRHPWPGNVRELENCLLRAAVLAPGRTLTAEDLQLSDASPPPPLTGSLADTLRGAVAALVRDPERPARDLHAAVVAAVERPLIELILEQTGGNQLRAADLLGINRNTLRKKITSLGIALSRGGKRPPPLPRSDARMILPSRIYCIVDPLDTGRDPVELARQMLDGGARLLQLRLKGVATGTLVDTAARIRELTAAAGARFVVNDRVDVALAVGADGVHLGQDDLPVAAARAILGPDCWIGFSTHSEAQLDTAAGCGADYFSLGPIFATTSKSPADPVIGCARVRAARARVAEPLVAIGGITAATALEVLAAGADAVSVIAAVVRAPDVARATAELLAIAGE